MRKMSVGNQIAMKSAVKAFLASIAIMALFSIFQNTVASMPQIGFACQIYHPETGEELKLVQANSREEAIGIAHLKNDSKHKYFEVRECVIVGEERFRDSKFQRNLQETPR